MQLLILAVGKGRTTPEHLLARDWLARLPQSGGVMSGGSISGGIIEVESKLPPGLKRTDDESQRLVRAIPDGAALAVLDPRGKDHSSEDMAALIGDWQDQGRQTACFAIGGADGHNDLLRDRADRLISFGRATWPHMLCRAMLAEQLYRASAILAGHPYHRAG
jgi:23S rRNA (pseudouridine1915-N3)-methyltransferase